MRPCPFGELAAEHPSVVCRAHLGLMRGVLDTLRSPIEATALEPFVKPNLCLVHLELPPDASAGKPGRRPQSRVFDHLRRQVTLRICH